MISVITILLPLTFLFFLPLTEDFYTPAKWIYLGLLTFLLIISSLRQKKIVLNFSWLNIGWLLLTLASLISLINSANKIEALLSPFGPLTFIYLSLWLLFGQINHLRQATKYSILVLALLLLALPNWTPTGSLFTTFALLVIGLPLYFDDLIKAYSQPKRIILALRILELTIICLGIIIATPQIFKLWPTNVLPFSVDLNIVKELVKNWRYLLFGVGPEQYNAAFATNRTLWLNQTVFWSSLPTFSSSFLGQLSITGGIFSLAALIMILVQTLRSKLNLGLWLAFISLLILPPNLPILVICLIFTLLSNTNPRTISLSNTLKIILIIICLIPVYGIGRYYLAEVFSYQARLASVEGLGTLAYQHQTKAIQLNPYFSRYHQIYSRINLALALSLDNQEKENEEIVTNLIQQSVRAGKIATQLAPNQTKAWENLGFIYQSLISSTQNAADWSIAAYQQAIKLSPFDPELRIRLGTTYISLKRYDDALSQFQAAISLKPDFANAYYNLANVFRQQQEKDLTLSALQKTLELLPFDSTDRTKVETEIKQLLQ